jgi:hypothetical protein
LRDNKQVLLVAIPLDKVWGQRVLEEMVLSIWEGAPMVQMEAPVVELEGRVVRTCRPFDARCLPFFDQKYRKRTQ